MYYHYLVIMLFVCFLKGWRCDLTIIIHRYAPVCIYKDFHILQICIAYFVLSRSFSYMVNHDETDYKYTTHVAAAIGNVC